MAKKVCAALAGAALVLTACQTAGWDNQDALAADKLEIQLTEHGKRVEVEYHVSPDKVPAAIRRAMDGLHPGGAFTGAERERHGSVLYYELTRKVDGMEVEAMFNVDGTLHSEEVQVAADKVPAAVKAAAMGSLLGASADKWEEIRDSGRRVTQYHVKMKRGANRYKVILSTDGKVLAIYREVPAEVEVRLG
ncbi:MAG: hypothetical protein ACE5JG_04320 [Planctomycetota bacterium]